MSVLPPSLGEFLLNLEYYRSIEAAPKDWQERRIRVSRDMIPRRAIRAQSSYISIINDGTISGSDNNEEEDDREDERKTRRHIMFIPNLPVEAWMPEGGLDAFDKIDVIIFVTDGYTLVRDPASGENYDMYPQSCKPPGAPKIPDLEDPEDLDEMEEMVLPALVDGADEHKDKENRVDSVNTSRKGRKIEKHVIEDRGTQGGQNST